jgi:phosphoglycerate kinase
MNFIRLQDMEIDGKKVIVRADYNVPLKGGKVSDDTRIRRTLPTINYLLEKKCKIILMSHLGRPDRDLKKGVPLEDVKKRYTMRPVAEKLRELLGQDVSFVEDYIEKGVTDSRIILLENLRFYKGEKKNDEAFAKKLASFADIYVNDGFGACHREHASVTGITKFLPSCAGFLVQKEIKQLSKLLNPEKPFIAIIGGAKADKIGVIRSLLPKVSRMIIGGVLANTFQKAQGIDIKNSKFDEETLGLANEFISEEKIVLPEDVIAAEKFDEHAESRNVAIGEIPDGWIIMDIGKKTVDNYKNILTKAKTVLWGGPLGVFEFEKFSNGTRQIAEFISELDAVTIIGGGDSAAAVEKFGLADKMTHVSTGGGASLEFIEKDGRLPAIVALEEAAKR